MTHLCGAPTTTTGEPCQNPVDDLTAFCAAGHPNISYNPQAAAANALAGGAPTVADVETLLADLASDPQFADAWKQTEASTKAEPLITLTDAAGQGDADAFAKLAAHVAESKEPTQALFERARDAGPPHNWEPLLAVAATRPMPHSAKIAVKAACEAGVPPRSTARMIALTRHCAAPHVAELVSGAKLTTAQAAELAAESGKRFRFAATAGWIEGLVVAGREPRESSREVIKAMMAKYPDIATDKRFMVALNHGATAAGGSAPQSPVRTAILQGAADAGLPVVA